MSKRTSLENKYTAIQLDNSILQVLLSFKLICLFNGSKTLYDVRSYFEGFHETLLSFDRILHKLRGFN
jgi:hypothetical protein